MQKPRLARNLGMADQTESLLQRSDIQAVTLPEFCFQIRYCAD